ncbi:MAG: GDSL-type esterase/lipase family protein [Burkholderiales bacterium]
MNCPRKLGLLFVLMALLGVLPAAYAQTAMQWLTVDDARLHWTNAMGWEPRSGGLQPVRVPKAQRDKWSQENQKKRAMSGAGVSVKFRTDARRIVFRTTLLEVETVPLATNPEDAWEFNRPSYFSLYRDGKYLAAIPGKIQSTQQEVVILNDSGPAKEAEYQVLFPFYYRNAETVMHAIGIDAGAKIAAPAPDKRARVLFYGDSITHGHGVTAPHETYVWQACERAGCVSLNYGFGGTAWGERIVAETIADRGDWDALVIAIGTNSFGGTDGASRQKETAVQYGDKYRVMLDIIRARWPAKPIVAMTPILHRSEILGTRNANGEVPMDYRVAIERVVRERQVNDKNIFLIDGLKLVGDQQDLLVTDLVHPNDIGMRNMAIGAAAVLRPLVGR